MRLAPLPPPSEEALGTRRIHELIRDYPELLATIVALGVDVGEAGNETLPEVFPHDDSWAPVLREAVSWRGESSGRE